MSEVEKELRALVNPKTKKPVHVRVSMNKWIAQVIVENKRWTTVYHSIPPNGMPTYVAKSQDEAREMALHQALEDAIAWLPTLLQKSDTDERDAF